MCKSLGVTLKGLGNGTSGEAKPKPKQTPRKTPSKVLSTPTKEKAGKRKTLGDDEQGNGPAEVEYSPSKKAKSDSETHDGKQALVEGEEGSGA